MDQGDSDDETAAVNGPTSPLPKLRVNPGSAPIIQQRHLVPSILGPPPMKPPTPANITGPIRKRKSRFDVNDAGKPVVISQTPPLSKVVIMATSDSIRTEALKDTQPSLESRKVSSPEGSLLSPEQRNKMTFGFKAVRTLPRPKKKIVFSQEQPEAPKEVRNTKAGNSNPKETPPKKTEEPLSNTNTSVVDQQEAEVSVAVKAEGQKVEKENQNPAEEGSDVIMDTDIQIAVKQKEHSKKKVEETSDERSQSRVKSISRSRSRRSRSRSRRSRSRSFSRSRSRYRRRGRSYSSSSSSRSRSRSRSRRPRSSSYSRSSSYTSRSRSRRRRRRRRSSSYSTSSSSY